MASAANTNLNAVRETMDVLLEISRLLNTGLDMESLSICVRLCEQGINPEALSAVIKELRKASDSLKASENSTNWSRSLIIAVWELQDYAPLPDLFLSCALKPIGFVSVGTQSSVSLVTNCSWSVLWLVSEFQNRGINLSLLPTWGHAQLFCLKPRFSPTFPSAVMCGRNES